MSDFQESRIHFHFQDANWAVIKYDEHPAHKNAEKALKSTKAVDFMGIHDGHGLYLIEVKNYREHVRDKQTREKLKGEGEELMHAIALKVRDTIATATGAARFSTNDEEFFTQVNRLLLDDTRKLTLIACIELDASGNAEYKAQMSVWQQKLKQKLNWLHSIRVSINSVSNISDIVPDMNAGLL